MSRLLSHAEKAAYERFTEILRENDRVPFREQLATATVIAHEPGYTLLSGFSESPPIAGKYQDQLVRGYYSDVDGNAVHIFMHFAHGYLSWIERFRIDASRYSLGRTRAMVEMVVPPADAIRFWNIDKALGDIPGRALTVSERASYARFADTLRNADIPVFIAQLTMATIVKHDTSHTTFGNVDSAPPLDSGWYEHSIDAFYDDLDHSPINMILHFVDGRINWLERYRFDMEPVLNELPEAQDIRFVLRPSPAKP